MATQILIPKAVDNLSTDLTPLGSLPWENPENVLVEDNYFAHVEFDGTNGATEFLWIHSYDSTANPLEDTDILIEDLAVQGIEVKVVRSGVGLTKDFYVGLTVYNHNTNKIELTSPGKHTSTFWESGDSTTVYGAENDTWNKDWILPNQVATGIFGFAIAAESPNENNHASIDFIELKISYHSKIEIDTTGGMTASGTAIIQETCNQIADGGPLVGGHGILNYPDLFGSGGLNVGGASDNSSFIQPVGGIEASISSIYNKIQDLPNWTIPLDGAQNIPSNDSTNEGIAEIWLKKESSNTSRIIWRITYTDIGSISNEPTKVLFKKGFYGEETNVVAFSAINLSNGTASPIEGHHIINDSEKYELNNSYWYIELCSDDYPWGELRGQIWTHGTRTNGSASTTFYDNFESSAGLEVGGLAEVPRTSYQPIGGVSASISSDLSYTSSPVIYGGINIEGVSAVDPWVMIGGIDVSPSFDVSNNISFEHEGGINLSGTSDSSYSSPAGGGILAGSSATILQSETSTGGCSVGGLAMVEPYVEVPTGGLLSSGIAIVEPYLPVGGISAGGNATQTQRHDPELKGDNTFGFIARSEYSVPPSQSDRTAVAEMRLDTENNVLYWKIYHNMSYQLDAVRLRGPAEAGETADTKISIDAIQSVSSPIIGSANVLPSYHKDILEGRWYLYMRADTEDYVLRSQITKTTGVKADGKAIISHHAEGVGGATASPSSSILFTYNHNFEEEGKIYSGCKILGGAKTSLTTHTHGGCRSGGTSPNWTMFAPVITGGALCNGEILEDATFNTSISGGLNAGSLSIISIDPKIGGGSIASGNTENICVYNPDPSNGAILNGLVHLTFFDQFISIGKVLVGGSSAGDRIKPFVKQGNNSQETRNSLNTFNSPRASQNKLIPPTNDISPKLREDRFRMRHNPRLCRTVNCKDGYVPSFVIKAYDALADESEKEGSQSQSAIPG